MQFKVIKEIYERKANRRERDRKELIENVLKAISKLLKEVSFEEAYLFGSITIPYRFWEQSDVDIAFKGLDPDLLFFTISYLNREIGRDVNVVPIERLHFKDKIIREGVRWKKG